MVGSLNSPDRQSCELHEAPGSAQGSGQTAEKQEQQRSGHSRERTVDYYQLWLQNQETATSHILQPRGALPSYHLRWSTEEPQRNLNKFYQTR